MTFEFPDAVSNAVAKHPYPLLFATISGAHLYGFPSRDSDWDIRGVHVLPAREIFGLFESRDTVQQSVKSPIELDLVTHDAKKFFGLLLKRNGYVLEQLYSPLIVKSSAEHEELKSIAKGCMTRFHSHHYLGFAETQWGLFEGEQPRRVKPLLYTFRVLLTGIQLMNTGQVEANLLRLNNEFRLPYIEDLVARKTQGVEQSTLTEADVAFYKAEYRRLRAELELSSDRSTLPESPSCKQELSDLLIRLRESQTYQGK
jgi:predicted nucleotidyltransferase